MFWVFYLTLYLSYMFSPCHATQVLQYCCICPRPKDLRYDFNKELIIKDKNGVGLFLQLFLWSLFPFFIEWSHQVPQTHNPLASTYWVLELWCAPPQLAFGTTSVIQDLFVITFVIFSLHPLKELYLHNHKEIYLLRHGTAGTHPSFVQ
jgi:hypothetical protein